jgi:hypothetical protein
MPGNIPRYPFHPVAGLLKPHFALLAHGLFSSLDRLGLGHLHSTPGLDLSWFTAPRELSGPQQSTRGIPFRKTLKDLFPILDEN